jgi:hypothetical protein
MLPALVEIPKDVGLTQEESFLVEKLSRNIPLLAYLAESGKVEAAISRARKLFGELHELEIPQFTHPLLAFYRFQLLELKALVKELNCKHKTFPERFLTLAESTGFRLLEYRRVYASSSGDMNGGSYVFVFRKEGDYADF